MTGKSVQRNAKESGFSKLIINLALAAVCLSVAVMILAVGIVKGYQNEVRDKLLGFHSPIVINHLDLNKSYESFPVQRNNTFEQATLQVGEISGIHPFCMKAGIIKTEEAFEGILLKGTDSDYNWSFIREHLVSGKLPKDGKEILISAITANRLGLQTGGDLYIYFVEEPPRVRKLRISGIFDSGMGEMDELYAFTDMQLVQKLNRWSENEISGYEIRLNHPDQIQAASNALVSLVPVDFGITTIFDSYPALFDWLGLLDMNVVVILLLMAAVAGINMITALLILILERTQMIGLLKAMGAEDSEVSKIFLWMGIRIIGFGLLLGNLLGLGLAFLQKQFGLVRLDPGSYYLNQVPVEINLYDLCLINLFGFAACFILLLIPSRIVSRVEPVRTIHFN